MYNYGLAKSLYPRLGFDQRNSDMIPFIGPSSVQAIQDIYFIDNSAVSCDLPGKCVLASDDSFRMIHNGYLYSISREGYIFWSTILQEYDGKKSSYASYPIALKEGFTLIASRYTMHLIDKKGDAQFIYGNIEKMFDDSRCAPNLTHDGYVVYSSPLGSVFLFEHGQFFEIGNYGYYVLPPAVYDDNTLAISGYSKYGFSKVDLRGNIIWQSTFYDADLTATINQSQFAAVGSINDGISYIFSPYGEIVGHYDRASLFSEYFDDGWIALSQNNVARISLEGKLIWEKDINFKHSFSNSKALVDLAGKIYVPCNDFLLCLDSLGNELFRMENTNYIKFFNSFLEYL